MSTKRRATVGLILALVAALLLRLDGLSKPALEFQPARQYHGAILARGYYLDLGGGSQLPRIWRRAAQEARRREDVVEPPLMEFAAAVGYRAVGGVHLWLPRLLAILCWLAGAVVLFRIALRLNSASAALASVLIYLFLPFGIFASRSFQPDSLMVLLLLTGVLSILRFEERPNLDRLLLAGAVSGVAILSKPGIPAIPLIGLFAALQARRSGVAALLNGRTAAFLGLALGPSVAYLLIGMSAGFLHPGAGSRVMPDLLVDPSFWRGWGSIVGTVLGGYSIGADRHPDLSLSLPLAGRILGLAVLLVALYGISMFRPGVPRTTVIALWAGYAAYGLVFTYHIHTHDYYSLPLIPIAALSLGPPAAGVIARLVAARPLPRFAGLTIAAAATVLSLVGVLHQLRDGRAYRKQVAVYQRIGEATHHSARVVFLDRFYGAPLEYYGWLAGWYWPTRDDLAEESLEGLRPLGVQARLTNNSSQYAPTIPSGERPEFFAVTSLEELDAQPSLRLYLASRRRLAAGQGCVVYQLGFTLTRPPPMEC